MAQLQGSQVSGSLIVSQSLQDSYPMIESVTGSLTAAATISVPFSASSVFTLTPNAATQLNFRGAQPGLNKSVVVTGAGSSYTITLAADDALSGSGAGFATFNLLAGEYDDTAGTKNFIQVQSVGVTGSTGQQEFWYSISQPA